MTKLKKLLQDKMNEDKIEIAPSSFEVIGNREKAVAIVEIPEEMEKEKVFVAAAIMEMHSNVKTVLKKLSERKTEFRTRDFEIIAGDKNTEVMHKEYGYWLKVDSQKVYFSAREAVERQRIAQQVKSNEIVMIFFAGIGAYAIAIAKKQDVEKIYAIEINPDAVGYMKENARINRIAHKIVPILGDVKKSAKEFYGKCDRVVMPLPLGASEFLEDAVLCLKKKGIVHFYILVDKNDFESANKKIERVCKKLKKRFRILNQQKVSEYSPRKWKVCIDFEIL